MGDSSSSRVRHDAATIEALYGATSQAEQPTQRKILLRLFVHFHGEKVILLLHGYDKGGDDSPRKQNKEIQEARKRLAHWRSAEVRRVKGERKSAFDQAAAFGSVIFGARKARGLRQSDLAELSGVTQADISRIERGQVAPTTQTLLKLTDALGVEIQFVLAEPGTTPAESISLRVPVAG